MRNLIYLLIMAGLMACAKASENREPDLQPEKEIDVQAELASIEETRAGFQQAIKEGRFSDLRQYSTQNVKSLTPDCGAWEPFKALRSNPSGEFHYDSLVMRPTETIIVSDSVAYDFGMSSTYYTNEAGQPVELTATFLAVLKKDKTDGKWKLHREVANTRRLE
ncbi:DUF4440 domain-containing protein [Roseivirga sp. BDSF3-8]|uniref:YybH family protein n=1 Tax=Roseivirga sp. BDSF3-8 TaxID=3241598 RepID=UPI0035322849